MTLRSCFSLAAFALNIAAAPSALAGDGGPWPPGSPDAIVWTLWTTPQVNLEFARKSAKGVFDPLPMANVEAGMAEPFINKRIEQLRTVTREHPLHERGDRALRQALVASGLPVARSHNYLAGGVNTRRLLERLETKIYENHRDHSFLVTIIDPRISPDLTQLHLYAYFRIYRAGRTQPAKEGELHWLSDPIGEPGTDERWAERDAARFHATLDTGLAGLAQMLKLAIGPLPVPVPTRHVMYRDAVATEVAVLAQDGGRITYAFAPDVLVSEPARTSVPTNAAAPSDATH